MQKKEKEKEKEMCIVFMYSNLVRSVSHSIPLKVIYVKNETIIEIYMLVHIFSISTVGFETYKMYVIWCSFFYH